MSVGIWGLSWASDGHPGSPQSDYRRAVMCALMMGEQEALVVDVSPWDVHGVGYVDVTLALRDRTVEVARLGRESVPSDLRPGEEVLVSKAVNVIVSIRRHGAG